VAGEKKGGVDDNNGGRWRGRKAAAAGGLGSRRSSAAAPRSSGETLAHRGRAGARGAAANEDLRGDGWRRRKIMPHGSWRLKMTVVRWIFIQW